MIKKILLGLSVALMLIVVGVSFAAHLYKIDVIPYGYHVDELSGSVTVECLATEGVDAHDNHYPWFGQLNYGTPKPPTYMYPAVLWGKFFGFTVPSLRCFSVLAHLLGIVGIFFLARLFFGNMFGLCVMFAAAISPWVWAPSRVAFESLFASTFSIWGLYFFFRRTTVLNWIIAGLLLAMAMYSYPPMRLQVPLMIITLGLYSTRKLKSNFLLWTVFIVSLCIPLLPLIAKTATGEIQQRFNYISITAPGYLKCIGKTSSLKDLCEIFLTNYSLHLTPDFLFKKGDPSLIHSLGHFGILSWLDMGALICCLLSVLLLLIPLTRTKSPWFQDTAFLVLMIVNIFLAIIPAAITNSELPNSLRIVGGWPFMCLLTGYFMWRLQRFFAPLGLVFVIAGCIFFISLLKVYFVSYQEESKGMFSFWTLDQAKAAKSEQDWQNFMLLYRRDDYHFRYYLIHYRNETCTSTRLKWERQAEILQRLHVY
jgi:hypothetical protein